jgi:hypothetical protein
MCGYENKAEYVGMELIKRNNETERKDSFKDLGTKILT